MTGVPDIDQQRAQRRAEERARRNAEGVFRADVQRALENPGTRAVLARFLTIMGIDDSPFSTNGLEQSRAIGLQDAGRWWLNVIRAHCPEREAQVRQLMREFAKPVKPTTEEDSEDEH